MNLNHEPVYKIWKQMHQRCANSHNVNYRHYGGRGITVCDRWQSFVNFILDMGERPEGMTLDRINNDRGYYPENCRWATRQEQRLNQRERTAYSKSVLGIKGVRRLSSGNFQTRVGQRVIGTFLTIDEAVMAREEYCNAEKS